MMKPKEKNNQYVAGLHQGLDTLDTKDQRRVMSNAGRLCSADLLSLLESVSELEIKTIEDLLTAWNSLRTERKLPGLWEIKKDVVTGVFPECACPLVMSGLVALHPMQCLCSEAMLNHIFSKIAQKNVSVEMRQTIGRGDDVCEFIITNFR